MIDLRELPNAGKYGFVLADCPWAFVFYSGKHGIPQRAKKKHYDTMTEAELSALPVVDIVAPDAGLMMWVLDTHVDQALRIGTAWGFKYKSLGLIWQKMMPSGLPYIGLGHWFRSGGEVSIFFTRGKSKRLDRGIRQFISSPIREHSRKPDGQYERLERLMAGPRLELFATQTRPGWDSWGNQIGKFSRAV